MTYDEYCKAVKVSLKACRSPHKFDDLDPDAVFDARIAGVSPVMFARDAAKHVMSPARLAQLQAARISHQQAMSAQSAAMQQQQSYQKNTRLGQCPQCGSTNLIETEIKDNRAGAQLLVLFITVCCFCIAVILLPLVMNRTIGIQRQCRICGHAWRVG